MSPTPVLTLPVLTPEDITALLAESRTRGEYRAVINGFVKSGDLAKTLNAAGDKFHGKAASAVKQSVVGNIEKYGATEKWPTLKVLFSGDGDSKTAILVNMDVHAAQVADAAPATTEQ